VLEGEPPEEAVEVDWEAVEMAAETGVISFGLWPGGVAEAVCIGDSARLWAGLGG
jgi:hypothetical protein